MKNPNFLHIHETPHQAITKGMKGWIAKVKVQSTVPTSGEELWKKGLYDLVDDTDCDVSHATKKLLGLERDRYAEIHGAQKQKE